MTNRTKLLLPALFAAGIGIEAQAAEIPTNTAQMQAMDKITGRVSVINVPVNAEVKFGSFSVLVRDCRTRSPEETPENFAFVDVADTVNGNEQVNIFKGWMLSSSPALNAIEHPVYDVWLLKCIDTDVSGVQTLTPDELAARDQLPMQRTVETTPQKANVREDGFEEINLSGEPIDLLPAAVREEGEESAAQAEIIPFKPEGTETKRPVFIQPRREIIPFKPEGTETDADDAETAEFPADENAPHSLLNFPRPDNEKRPDEITTNIEIRENATDEAETVINSDTRILSLPENGSNNGSEPKAAETTAPAEGNKAKTGENAEVTPETDGAAAVSPVEPADEAAVTEMTAAAEEENKAETGENPETTPENAAAPKVSEDTLRELEEELSRKLADD